MVRPSDQTSSPRRGTLSRRALHVAVLTTFAVSLPLLQVLGQDATFFVAHRTRAAVLLGLVLSLCVVLPALPIAVELAVDRLSRRAGRVVHHLLVAGLAAAALLIGLKRIAGVPGEVLVVAALLLGGVASLLTLRTRAFPTFLTALAPVLLLTPVYFLFLTPVKSLLLPARTGLDAPVAISHPGPVVMIVFDELSLAHLLDASGHVDPGLYPNFAALAETSYWFRDATTVAQSTGFAIPAILTGRYPPGDLLPVFDDYPENLFSLLSPSYRLRVFESATDLCPPGTCGEQRLGELLARVGGLLRDAAVVYLHVLLPPDLTSGLPPISDNWMHFLRKSHLRDERDVQFSDFLAAIRSGQDRTFYFLHSLLPHVEWTYLPSGKVYGGPDAPLSNWGIRGGRWLDDEWLVVQNFQRYLLQLRYVDRLLGETIEALEDAGLFDRSLLVITADHGVSFRPRVSRRALEEANYGEILPVPLFVKLPSQRQGVLSDQNVETIDIVPTLAQALGIERVPWPVDGQPLLGSFEPRPRKVAFPSARDRGEAMQFDPSLADARYEATARMIDLFGSGEDPQAIFRAGPWSELVGQRVAALAAAGRPRAEARLSGAHHYRNVDPDARFVPARIQGHLSSQPNQGNRILAIGVNGTVRAVTRTFDTATRSGRFTALVPEQALLPGRNHIEVLDVTESQPETTLEGEPAAAIFADGFESGGTHAWSG